MSTDTGASAARTRLAWRRTLLTAAAVTLLAVRPAFADPAPGQLLAAAAAMAGWATLVAVAYRRVGGLAAYPPRAGHRTVRACAALAVLLALIGGLVVTI